MCPGMRAEVGPGANVGHPEGVVEFVGVCVKTTHHAERPPLRGGLEFVRRKVYWLTAGATAGLDAVSVESFSAK